MAAPVISISSDILVESLGSSFHRVIIVGSIYVEVLVAPEVGAAAVALPAGVIELDTYSSSKADPSESSPAPVSVAPVVYPFLCLDDSKSDTEMHERHVSPTPHDAMLTRWRSRFASRSSSPTTSTLEIPTTPILPVPSTVVAPSFKPCKALTARKSVRPLPSYRLALKTPRCSNAYLRWRSAPLSTMYPPTTSKSSARNSYSESYAGPSHKRCRFPAATNTLSIHATRALVPSRDDLLPPRKRFRDSISPEDSVEEYIDTDVLEDIKADTITIEVAVDRTRSSPMIEVEEGLQDIYDHVIKIPL
nr:hypothetical protein [Tanacetum cinerariifolium]